MKIVINTCFGGFGLSEQAMLAYAARKGITLYPDNRSLYTVYWTIPDFPTEVRYGDAAYKAYSKAYSEHTMYDRSIDRDDPDLVAVVEQLGSKAASGKCAQLEVVEIPDGIDWEIDEYDGREHIAEKHRTWG